ncbi:armadillo-type protein [Boletus edulis BED1]|uniref:Armadillo-type protein n=1 Tax=Boletus edulis BED1 TaxID=1328754 RepID=A0AAD4C093_BOLED|nr:armadillo-type protein [Boletus edulis BED1]
MDVPFISSGAMSRAQYALVRKLENAASPQAADQIVLNELDVIRRNLQQRHLSIKDCKECLILILHCTMSLSTAGPGDLEFAFPHAVNLAGLGQSPMDKKIGYIFCMELMPPSHELQLMLVNTLRKDLESNSVARICLALDMLIQVPNEDVIPAVDTRLQTLLEHQSVAVRQRALMAHYTLFQRDAERLARLEDIIQRHLRHDPSGIGLISIIVGKVGKLKHSESLGKLLNSQLQHQYRESSKPSSVLSILQTLRRGEMKLESGSVPVVLDIIKRVSQVPMRAVLRDAFMLLSTVSPEALRQSRWSSIAVTSIRHFLSSRDPDDLFLFVSCLSCLDPSIWAGTLPSTVAVLDEWEVQAVIRLLDSPDGLIRKTTIKILHSVDPVIVETYYSQALRSLSPSLTLSDKNEYVARLLEIINVQDANDVDQYARRLKDLFSVVEGEEHGQMEDLPILDLSVERILNGIRERETTSRISCVTALAVSLTELHVRIGPTLMVVISALVSEYCGKVSISPMEMLRGMATRLASYAPSVQDACLLTILRLSVECEDVPEQVTAAVRRLSQHTGAYLRRRCDLFLTLSTQRRVLAEIISRAPSSSLPDFLSALTGYKSNTNVTPSQSPRTISSGRQDLLEFSPSQGTGSARKLRYEAYAAPQLVPSLRYHSSPRRQKGSASSPEGSTRSLSHASDASNSLNELAKTISPGELTLAAAQSSFDPLETSRILEPVARPPQDDLASRVELIALDSPFMTEPAKEVPIDADFMAAWDSMENANVRGWCEASLDMIVRLLQSLQFRMRVIATDQPPFEGELKVLVQGPESRQHATLRLREGEDESCLWRLRCDDPELRTSIKRLMEDI